MSKAKKIYEVSVSMYEDGRVSAEEKGCDILVSRPVARHLNIGLLETLLAYMKANVIATGKDEIKKGK